jgi:hypothetical protein
MSYIPRFPQNPEDGREILDRYGNRWQYDIITKAWISKGVIAPYRTVDESNSGIITPEIFTKLKNLDYYNKTSSLASFKISPAIDAYWYYFRSSDKLIKFKPEGNGTLRVEIDRGRLFQLLLKNRRTGPPGKEGDMGDPGSDGLPGDSICDTVNGEPDYAPVFDKDKLSFFIYTPTPLVSNGPLVLPNDHVPNISVRLYRITDDSNAIISDQLATFKSSYNDQEAFKRTVKLVSDVNLGINKSFVVLSKVYKVSPVTIAYPALVIDIDPLTGNIVEFRTTTQAFVDETKTRESINYNPDTGIVSGIIYSSSGNWDPKKWTVRSRQRGPDGPDGFDGETRLRIGYADIDSSNVEAACPLVNVRLDLIRKVLLTQCVSFANDVCVSKVRVSARMNTLTSGNIKNSLFAAAEMSLGDCKSIHIYKPELGSYYVPELDFDTWEPQGNCVTQRHYDRHKFDWVSTVEGGACSPFGVYNKKPNDAFPYKIVTAAIPPDDECCQEDFFYCPNVQDGPCEGEPPLPPPEPPEPPSPSRVAAGRALAVHNKVAKGNKQHKYLDMGTKNWKITS